MTVPAIRFALLGGLLVASAACAPAQPRSGDPPRPVARAAAPVASPTPTLGPVKLGEYTYNNHGERELDGKGRQGIDAGDYYFKGTFLRGEPGQKITLRLKNVGTVAHNFSIPSLEIDRDLPLNDQRVDIAVTLPQSGAVRFFCKLHAAQGMNGQLIADDAAPRPLAFRPELLSLGLPRVEAPAD